MVAILRLKNGSRLVVLVALVIALPLILSTGITTKAAPPAQTPPPATSTPTKPILLTDPVPDPKQDGVLWFLATGHTLRGSFLSYWQQNGGLAQFGYPLTEEFFEPVGPDNKLIQVEYFERNRFEHHPENQPPYDVLLGTLGRDFHPRILPLRSYHPLYSTSPKQVTTCQDHSSSTGRRMVAWLCMAIP